MATTEFVGVYFDTEIRVPAPLPASVHRLAETLRVDPDTTSNDGNTTEEMVAV